MTVQSRFVEGCLKVTATPSRTSAVVRSGTPLLDVALMMESQDFQFVIVQDANNSVTGIVSQSDVTRYINGISEESSDSWQSRPVEDLMATRFATATASHPRMDQAEVTGGHDVECVPILEQGRIVGVMTRDDVLISWRRMEPALRAASTDDVTRLANRTMFTQRLDEEWKRSSRSGEPLAVLLFDVDYFKQVNDSCGHMVGDRVLAGVGKSVKRSLRSYDVVARIGGDEFAALCFNCNSESIDPLIHRIQQSVCEMKAPVGLPRRQLTLSIGAAVIQSGFSELSTDELLSRADACLYQSKAAGRNRAFRTILNGAKSSPPICADRPEYSEGSVDYVIHPEGSSFEVAKEKSIGRPFDRVSR